MGSTDDDGENDNQTSSSSGQHIIQVSWLLNDEALTPVQELLLLVLDHLLVMTESSILKKRLLESQLGDSIVGWGISLSLIKQYFSMGLSGVTEENVLEVEKLVLDTMNKAAMNGFTDDEISASMNTLEFQLREGDGSSDSKGLSLMFASLSKWIYDNKPTYALKYEEALAELKEIINESGTKIFQELLNDYFIDNTHRVTTHLYPVDTYDMDQSKEVSEEIEKFKEGLSDEELQNLIDFAIELKDKQIQPDTKEDIATIPTVTIDDVNPVQTDDYPIDVLEHACDTGIAMVSHELGSTSGILYADFGVDVSSISFEDIGYLQLFNSLLGSIDIDSSSNSSSTGNYKTIDDLTQFIGMHAGDMHAQLLVTSVNNHKTNNDEHNDKNIVLNDENFVTKLIISGKAISDKTSYLFQLFYDILLIFNITDAQDI